MLTDSAARNIARGSRRANTVGKRRADVDEWPEELKEVAAADAAVAAEAVGVEMPEQQVVEAVVRPNA